MVRRLTCWLILALPMVLSADAFPQTAVAEKPASKETNKKDAAKKTDLIVPVFSFYRPILESPAGEDPLLGSQGGESLKDLVKRLEKAAEDEEVKAVVVLLGNATMGTGQLEEIQQAMHKIREQGKPIYAHADSLTFRGLALLSQATRISVAPVGDLFINGLYGSQPHLRGLLDKIHVTPDFITCGDYKSAGEMFMRSEPSPQAAEMYDWLFKSIYDTYIKMIAEGRGESVDVVKQWIDHGLYSAENAAKLGIIDAAEYRQDLVEYVQQQHGDDVELTKIYGKDKKTSLDLNNPFAVFKIWADLLKGPSKEDKSKPAVAIVYVEGPIVPGRPDPSPFASGGVAYSEPIRKALDKAAEDESVKAVVLRVNSPGGSAVASEIILQATKRVAAKKPLVVSMGDVAGSGGYYVSCGAETIFADAATITASIGVVAGKLATNNMWESIGVHWYPIEQGKNSGMMASGDVFTAQQKETLQTWMDEVYEVFKGHVVAIRGDRLAKPIDEIAGGRVFTGQQALELGLVDRLGTLSDAIAFAAGKAEVEKYDVRVIPRPKNILEQILSEAMDGDTDGDPIRIATGLSGSTGPLWQSALPLLREMQPQQAAALSRALTYLDILQRERICLMTPEIVIAD